LQTIGRQRDQKNHYAYTVQLCVSQSRHAHSAETGRTAPHAVAPPIQSWVFLAATVRTSNSSARAAESAAALDIVKTLKEQKRHETLVFPSLRSKVLSDMTLTALLRRVKAKSKTPGRVATAHGFRSSSRQGPGINFSALNHKVSAIHVRGEKTPVLIILNSIRDHRQPVSA